MNISVGSVLTTEIGTRFRFCCILVFYFKDILLWHCAIKCLSTVLCCHLMSSVNSGSWSKIREALHCDCLHNVHQTLVFEKGKENPVIHDMSPYSQHLCIFLSVLLCLVHWMAIIWTPLCHSHTHCIILLTWLTCQEHPTLCSAPALHLPSLAISDLYVLSSAQSRRKLP